MASNNKKNILKDPNFKPKFNFYWIYGAMFVLFVVFQFFNSENLTQKEISQNKFESVLLSGDISRIVIVNRNIAQIYIKEEALSKDEYSKLGSSSLFNKNAPMFEYNFGDLQNFEKKLELAKTENKRLDFDKQNDEQTDLFDSLLSYLPFIFLIGLWIFFMKRMSGGGAGGGGAGG